MALKQEKCACWINQVSFQSIFDTIQRQTRSITQGAEKKKIPVVVAVVGTPGGAERKHLQRQAGLEGSQWLSAWRRRFIPREVSASDACII